jgi:hypothetical protein
MSETRPTDPGVPAQPYRLGWKMKAVDLREPSRLPHVRRRQVRGVAAAALPCCWAGPLAAVDPPARAIAAAAVAVFVLVAVALVALPWYAAWRVWRGSARHRPPYEATVSKAGITLATGSIRTEYGWPEVSAVHETPGAFLLALSPGGWAPIWRFRSGRWTIPRGRRPCGRP